MKKKKEHKCWYCMTDAEKNEWLESERTNTYRFLMRIIRFLKLFISYYYRAFDFKRRFPESHIIQPFFKECSVCWHNSKIFV